MLNGTVEHGSYTTAVGHRLRSRDCASPVSTGLGKRRTQPIHRIVAYGMLFSGSAFLRAPLVWMLSTSLKTRSPVFRFPPEWVPEQFSGVTTWQC